MTECPFCGADDFTILANHVQKHCPVVEKAREARANERAEAGNGTEHNA